MHLQLCLLFLALAPAKPLAHLALTANLAWHLAAGSYREDLVAVFPLRHRWWRGGGGLQKQAAVAEGSPALRRFRI